MTEETEIKLKPCPFCGGEAILKDNPGEAKVKCANCECQTETFGCVRHAVTVWNHRTKYWSKVMVIDGKKRVCTHCGHEVKNGDKYCHYCGAWLKWHKAAKLFG